MEKILQFQEVILLMLLLLQVEKVVKFLDLTKLKQVILEDLEEEQVVLTTQLLVDLVQLIKVKMVVVDQVEVLTQAEEAEELHKTDKMDLEIKVAQEVTEPQLV